MVYVFRDQTKERAAANALRESEQRYRGVVEDIPVLICSFFPGGEINFVNKAYCDYFLKKTEELIGTSFLSLIPDCDRNNVLNNISTLSIQTPTQHHEHRVVSPSGQIRWQRWTNRALFDDEGKIVQYQSIGEDITERKKSEDEIRKLSEVVEQSPMYIVITDPNGLIEYVNSAFLKVTGYRPNEVLGKNPKLLQSGKTPASRYVELWNAILSGKTWKGEFINRKKDGSLFWERATISSTRNHEGRIKYFIAIKEDITELKNIEDQIKQSQKMEAIGNLAGGIAHDFNNILSSIIGFTELSLDVVKNESVVENNLKEIYFAGKRAKDLVNQILAFARQSDEALGPINVHKIALEVIKFIKSTIPTTIEIRSDINSKSTINGNASQVHQILMNLCTNAAYAMEAQGGILNIGLNDVSIDKASSLFRLNLKAGEYIELTVSDSGAGISQEHLGTIFDPYFTTKEPGKGTGLGLAVVHGIVEGYGGKITVQSQLGTGTEFKVYLPKSKRHRSDDKAVSKHLPTGIERILFLDDEPPIARIGGEMLKRLGYSVTVRTSSVDALQLFGSKPDAFDLVITDMTMPNMTGDKFASELIKLRPDIPIILCTGYSKGISEESAAQIGVRALIYKPVIKSDMAHTVRRVLDGTYDIKNF